MTRASSSSASAPSSLRLRHRNPSRRRRRYGAGSPCSDAALTAMHAGYELFGAPSNHSLGSTGMPLAAPASSDSRTSDPASPNSLAIPAITYVTDRL